MRRCSGDSARRAGWIGAASAALLLAACSDSRPPLASGPTPAVTTVTPPASEPQPAASAPPPGAGATGSAAGASIGVATMEPDGTIVLDLRAEGPGVMGDAQLRYPKSHAEYANVLKHLGGLKPGESKPVPPFP